MTNLNKLKKYRALYSYLENSKKVLRRISIIVGSDEDSDLDNSLKNHIERTKKVNRESVSILEVQEISLDSVVDPTLYVTFEDSKCIIARTDYDIRHNIPGRRYHKYKDDSEEYVIIERIRIKNVSKIKSTKPNWIYEN